jgi:hypothetical protein
MQTVKTLWALVQKDPHFMRRVNGWLTIFWIGMIPVSIVMGWLTSVAYVSALSLWALVSGHWAAWKQPESKSTRKKRRNPSSQGGRIQHRPLRPAKRQEQSLLPNGRFVASACFVSCGSLGVQVRRVGRKVWIYGVGFPQLLLCGETFTLSRGLFLTRGRLSSSRGPQSLLCFLP